MYICMKFQQAHIYICELTSNLAPIQTGNISTEIVLFPDAKPTMSHKANKIASLPQ